jgi:hypothetical protein
VCGVVGPSLQRLGVRDLPRHLAPEFLVDLTQVKARLRPRREDFDGPLEGRAGLLVLAQHAEGEAEAVESLAVLLSDRHGPPVGVHRVGPAPLLRVDVTEAEMGVAVLRVEADGLLEGGGRLIETPLEREARAVAVVDARAPALLQTARPRPDRPGGQRT